MKMPRTRIATAIADHTLAKGGSKAYAREVAAYLLSEGRSKELESLLRDVQADWAARGYVEVIARTAYPLSVQARNDITRTVTKRYPEAKVVVTEVRDESVVGGVQLALANEQLDLSIEAKLNKFKQLTTAGKE